MKYLFRTGLGLLALLALAACAGGMGGGTGGDRDTITRERLMEVGTSDVYEAVQRIRPEWLLSRGPRSMVQDDSPSLPSVYMSGSHLGDVEALRNLRPENVEALRYFDAGTASARFGMGHPRGVIEVIPLGSGGP